jgi:hypothetical protein
MIRLELVTALVSLNDLKGRHWSARSAGKTAWAAELTYRRAHALAPKTPPAGLQIVTIERLMLPNERPFDEDNLAGGNAKSLIDCLTRLGFWRDDNPQWLDRRYRQRPQTPDEHRAGTRTLVEITKALA